MSAHGVDDVQDVAVVDRRRRVRDGLVGALVLLLVLLIVAVVGFWLLSRPADEPSGSASPTPAPSATDPAGVETPDDLGPDETWLGDVDLSTSVLVSPDGTLLDVVATGRGIRSGPDGITAARLDVEATQPFATVAAGIGGGATLTAADDGRAELRRSVTVLGRTLDVRATGTVRAEDGLIVVEPQEIDLGGPDFLAQAVGAAVRELVTIRQPVEGVPEGLVLQEVTVRDDGFRARLSGTDVRLGG